MNVILSYHNNDELTALRIKAWIGRELNSEDQAPNFIVHLNCFSSDPEDVLSEKVQGMFTGNYKWALLWSKDVRTNAGLLRLSNFLAASNIQVPPCLLDRTPLPETMGAFGILGVDFSKFRVGAVNLSTLLLHNHEDNTFTTEAEKQQHLNNLKFMTYTSSYLKPGSLSHEEQIFIIKDILLTQVFEASDTQLYRNFVFSMLDNIDDQQNNLLKLSDLQNEFRRSNFFATNPKVDGLVERLFEELISKHQNTASGLNDSSSIEDRLKDIHKNLRGYINIYEEAKRFHSYLKDRLSVNHPEIEQDAEFIGDAADDLISYISFLPLHLSSAIEELKTETESSEMLELMIEAADEIIIAYQESENKNPLDFVYHFYEPAWLMHVLYHSGLLKGVSKHLIDVNAHGIYLLRLLQDADYLASIDALVDRNSSDS